MRNLLFTKKKTFILQQDLADCGVVCLQNILRHYGVEVTLERLRSASGTDASGATLLGLSHAAKALGFLAQGVSANGVQDLMTLTQPCILHIQTKEGLQHFVVLYSWDGQHFHLGDPATGMIKRTSAELEELWHRKVVLLLSPTENLLASAQETGTRWKWFYSIAHKYLPIFIITAVLGLAASLLNLSTAIFSQKLVDKLLVQPDAGKVFTGVILLTLLLLFKAGINYIRGIIVSRHSMKFNIDIVGNFYSRLLRMPKTYFENRKTGDMVARLNDTNRIQQVTSMLVGEVSIQVIMLLVSAVIVFLYSWWCGLIAILFVPLVFFLVARFQPRIIESQRAQLGAYSRNESNYIDNIKGIGTIKLFNREGYFFEKAKGIFSGYQAALLHVNVLRTRFHAIIDMLATVFLAALFTGSIVQIMNGQLKVGELVAIIQLGMVVMQMATSIALTNIQLQEARLAFERMYEFIAADGEKATAHTSEDQEEVQPESLRFQHLVANDISFGFPGRRPLIEKASLRVAPGDIVAITGESGQGKSTLFGLLQKFYVPGGGSLRVNGTDLQNIDTGLWRKTIGVVTQEPALFSGSVLENIYLDHCGKAEVEDIIAFCKGTGLHQFISRLPQGYATMIGEGGINISGGQKQLICLARCLYHKPQLLLLDEPTAAMDKHTEAFVIRLLQAYSRGAGIIVISHKDALIAMAHTVHHLEGGVLSPEEEQVETAMA